ncbi:plastid transcriptionally active 12 [Wolffia australiana]
MAEVGLCALPRPRAPPLRLLPAGLTQRCATSPNFEKIRLHSKDKLTWRKVKSSVSQESSSRVCRLSRVIRCSAKDGKFNPESVERAPYHCYMDSTSGQLEPASGARASIPTREYWPEGTVNRVNAARAPEPDGISEGTPSFGKKPGSRRKYKNRVSASGSVEVSNAESFTDSASDSDSEDIAEDVNLVASNPLDILEDIAEESTSPSDEYVIYQTEEEEDSLSSYEKSKKLGTPHPLVDPAAMKFVEEPKTSEELWWNWRKPEKEQWSRWQRRRPDVDTVFAKAMAETGQIKLYGDHPTHTETALARARKTVFKEERLQIEQKRLEEIGPLAYYSEWVKAWTRDTSREAVQKHYEETGEDENMQLQTMFQYQTAEEYRIMMGRDVRVQRDPLAMRMREDLIKEIWGGDPVYPTVNYIQEPNEVIDFRGPDFHEPTPDLLSFLMEEGKIISRKELDKLLAKEKIEELEVSDIDEAMARAVDIGENDYGDDSEDEGDDEVEEKVTRNWSVLKTTPQLGKSKKKEKKAGDEMALEDALDDSENLTDFLMDFDEE